MSYLNADTIVTETITVTTTGGAGSATGTTVSTALYGFLLDVFVDFHASAPATTDTTLLYEDPSNGQILGISNSATDNFFAPRKQACDSSAAAITGIYDLYVLNGTLRVNVAQSDALTGCVTARIRYYKTGHV